MFLRQQPWAVLLGGSKPGMFCHNGKNIAEKHLREVMVKQTEDIDPFY